MEFRKLINFGKSSYVISLPKSWIKRNNLKKKDKIIVKENDNALILSLEENNSANKDKKTTIQVDGKSNALISRELVAAYINNYNIIMLVGSNLQSKAKALRHLLENLMALEIVEQTSTKIIASDFLDMDNIDILNFIKKIDYLALCMLSDVKSVINGELPANSIIQRDNDVNRIAHLLFRTIKYIMETKKSYAVNSFELLNKWFVIELIEDIADCSKMLAGTVKKNKLTSKFKEKLINLILELERLYSATIKAYYDADVEKALRLSNMRDEFFKKCENLNCNPHDIELILRLKEIAVRIHEIGRLVYRYRWI